MFSDIISNPRAMIEDDPISYIWFKADIYNLDQSCPKIGELHGIKC